MAYKDKEKERAWHKKHYQENKEKIKKYQQDNRDRIRKRRKKYYQENKERIKKGQKEYRQKNKERRKERNREYYQGNKEKVKRAVYEYGRKNREKMREYRRRYYKEKMSVDMHFRISGNMRSAIYFALKGKKAGRHWEDLVGYTLKDLMIHLESQFDQNMNWENYGSYWEVDHRKPISLFKYSSPEDIEFKECWALNNLQPLEARENRIKHNKYERTEFTFTQHHRQRSFRRTSQPREKRADNLVCLATWRLLAWRVFPEVGG